MSQLATPKAKRQKISPPPTNPPRFTTAYLSNAFSLTTLPAPQRRSIAKLIHYVRTYFTHHDASHDFHHVCRVVRYAAGLVLHRRALGKKSHRRKSRARWIRKPWSDYRRRDNGLLVLLGALLHDIGDHKYTNLEGKTATTQADQLSHMLERCGLKHHLPDLCDKLLLLVSAISYSTERAKPDLVKRIIEEVPETAIVQDADRLDALGAVGIGRTFTYNAVAAAPVPPSRIDDGGGKGSESKQKGKSGMLYPVLHHYEKLLRLQHGMKTDAGLEEAQKRTRIMKDFVREWRRELEWGAVEVQLCWGPKFKACTV